MPSVFSHRTKIVATIGPASASRETIQRLIKAGMSVARLNFSHGSYEDHAQVVHLLRAIAQELDTPITLLQDLQGPKIRVGQLPNGAIDLVTGETLTLVPLADFQGQPHTAAIDYPYLAEEAAPGMQVLIDDGLLALRVESIQGQQVQCRILQGGTLKSRKGVNLPSLDVRLPAMTEKDEQDLEFGLAQGVDIVSLSFVRRADDVRTLKQFLRDRGAADMPVLAKIEKPQAVANLDDILAECDAVMVARGDLGVEVSPEKVPMIQKQIIRACNERSIPVITATQMLESMIHHPRPTRAEASDVANAILDGTDAVMLSGESAVGAFPVQSVEMLARIATAVEPDLRPINHPPAQDDATHALSEALNTIDDILDLHCIVAFTKSGYTAKVAAGERPRAPVVALTPDPKVYHRLNLVWGVKPILIDEEVDSFEALVTQAETQLCQRQLAQAGDRILILGGIPTGIPQGTNFIKLHVINHDL
ncbi:pyruvate kinase [Trichothermofontia sichuanensis B231]|uniref:pyruvate kinase n=1 Tax=Trichothermofontia sichuanensis TaxID=3045816 RepID=UPI0022474C5D|nr:pyruvate kinase [Trichothermofontia sichuanensis]UZQ53013.1 pyruvate kinase [Trichothermofontia sichuanensis B231]